MSEETRTDGARLLAIGLCLWFASMFLLVGVLMAVHQAVRVETGKGESIAAILMIMLISPVSVAMGICGAIKAYHAPELDNSKEVIE